MPVPPIGLGVTAENTRPVCCIGCCSMGDVDVGIDKQKDRKTTSNSNATGEQESSGSTVLNAIESSISNLVPASNSVITSQPRSTSGISIPTSSLEERIEDDIVGVLESHKMGRCSSVIYDICAPRCTAPFGCPSCGCAQGACGCGGLGRLCCGIFDACFSEGTSGSRLKISAWHRHLREEYDPMVLTLAEQKSGVHLQDLFIKGRGPTTREKELLEKACLEASAYLTSALGEKTDDSWKLDQDMCLSILEDKNWLEALNKTVSSNIVVSSQSFSNILIVSKNATEVGSCESFCTKNLGAELARMKMMTTSGIYGVLGVSEAEVVAQIIAIIIYNHPGNKGNFWVNKKDLRKLVCLVLGIRNLVFLDSKGNSSSILGQPRMQELRQKCQNNVYGLILACSTSFCNEVSGCNSRKFLAVDSGSGDDVSSMCSEYIENKIQEKEESQKDVSEEQSENEEGWN